MRFGILPIYCRRGRLSALVAGVQQRNVKCARTLLTELRRREIVEQSFGARAGNSVSKRTQWKLGTMEDSRVRWHLEGAKQGLREGVQIRAHGQSVVFIQNVWCVGQVVTLARSFGSVFSDLVEVVTAVAKVEQVPVVVIAPVLDVLAAEICKGMV